MKREVKFDVLKCLLMLFVAITHFFSHGMKQASVDTGFCYHLDTLSGCINFVMSQLICNLVVIAVNCFVFITGYFSVSNTTFRIDKLLKLWLEVVFYSILVSFIFFLCTDHFSLVDLLKSCIPIKQNTYWFATNYFAILLLAPFLSKMVSGLSRTKYLLLLAVVAFLTTELYKFPYGYTYGNVYGNTLLFFVLLWLIGGWFKLHGSFIGRYRGTIFLIWCVLQSFVLGFLTIKNVGGHYYSLNSSAPYHSWTFITSVLFFQWFLSLGIPDNRFTQFICKLAPYSFAVYLIHDHSLIRDLLWHNWVRLDSSSINSYYFLGLVCIIPLVIFIICVLIDIFRCKLFEIVGLSRVVGFVRKYNLDV